MFKQGVFPNLIRAAHALFVGIFSHKCNRDVELLIHIEHKYPWFYCFSDDDKHLMYPRSYVIEIKLELNFTGYLLILHISTSSY